MKTLPVGNPINRLLPPRRSPATVGRRWAFRAVVPRRRDAGGSLPCHAVALAKAGHSLLLLIILALCCFALAPAPKALGVLPSPTPDGGYPGNNTAEGQNALQSLTSGTNNAAIGFRALFKDTSGGNNTATGAQTLYSNTTGGANTANGYVALTSNTTGGSNTAIGSGALHGNTTASHNTATGYISLYNNTTGSFNTATGDRALYSNTTASQNTATGYQVLNFNTTGGNNTATGYQALLHNTTGTENTVVGAGSGQNLIIGSNNTYLGNFEGSVGGTDESSTIRIGDITENGFGSAECFIGGIFNNHQPRSSNVVVVTLDLTNDHLGWDVVTSPDEQGGQAPVQVPQRGVPAPRGPLQPAAQPQRQAMLNDKVEKLQATVAQQQKQIETLTAQLKEQASQIQKVSDQVELNKPAPQIVGNN